MRASRRVLAAAVVGVAAAFAGGTSAAAATAERVEFTQFAVVKSITVTDSRGPLIHDTVQLEALFGFLVQGGFTLNRVYNPETMRGTVSGTVAGSGPTLNRGDLRGVKTPDGMSGTLTLIRIDPDAGVFYRVVGRWETSGHPVAPTLENLRPVYSVHFEGVIIGPFPSDP